MEIKYIEIENNKIYKLLNNGCLIIVSTSDKNGNKNIAPIAWQTPVDYDPVTKILIVCDSNHKTSNNIKETKKFVIVIPHKSQKKLVIESGNITGNKFNKIEKLKVNYFLSKNYKYIIPEGSIGYIECELIKEYEEDGVLIFIGKAIFAEVNQESFADRLLCEKDEGKTLHHLGGNIFITSADKIL